MAADAETEEQTAPPDSDSFAANYRRGAGLVAVNWVSVYLGNGLHNYPLQFLLMEGLGLPPAAVARFLFIGHLGAYTKPLLGIFIDAVPLYGTRRRSYLLLGLLSSGALWLALGFAPRTYGVLLAVYTLLYVALNLVTAVVGGMMVEVGQRHGATGRIGAQRVALSRLEPLASTPLGAWLASRLPFQWIMTLSAVCYFAVVPATWRGLRERPVARVRGESWGEAKRQFRALLASRTLWVAAGAVTLVILAPGFGTPLLYYQRKTLGFSKEFIGLLSLVGGLFGILGALLYARLCRRFGLRALLGWSIVVHAGGTLFYLLYQDRTSALAVTALEGVAQTLAILPLYDLAMRATPKGSEALGYALMMSAWNLTGALSDWFGSTLYDNLGLTFMQLVWLNAGTTALVLVIVPFLPAALVALRDGQAREQ